MAKKFNVSQFTVIGDYACADASSLGLKPGDIPQMIEVAGFSYGFTGQMTQDGELLSWSYKAYKNSAPIKSIEVFND